MLRRFLSDSRGNYTLITAVAMVPIMGALALGVDYSEISRQRQYTLNALDAANVATARRMIEGATEAELAVYAQEFFEANLGAVDPANAKLYVTFPTSSTGSGKIKLAADLKYKPYFMPGFAGDVDFSAESILQLKNTLEVSLVLDNSGSMDFTGSGSGKKRIVLLKEAATQLVDTLSEQAKHIKQLDKPVQFAVVPFAASVNVGPQNASASWMDTDGRSPIHHGNFNWSTMTQALASSNGNRYVQQVNGVYYKRGTGWGAQENQKVTRFSMYNDMRRRNCTSWGWWGCSSYGPVVTFTSWTGCVESRPSPYDKNNATPNSTIPATLFVPMFAPDETDKRDGYNRGAAGNYWPDKTTDANDMVRQKYMPKYFDVADASASGPDDGPNASCTTNPITPLTDVATEDGLSAIKSAINAMAPNGGTNVPEGIAWGWRTVSGSQPFTQGRADTEKGNDKVVIVLTDGENTYYTPESLGYNDLAGNKSIYSSYGYTGVTQPGGTTTRLFMGTSNAVGKTDYSNGNYGKAMNEQMAATCANAQAAGMIVMTVALDLSDSNTAQKAQIEGLKSCSSDSRFRKDANGNPMKLHWNSTGGDLSKTFKEIADELSNLRFVS